jgi:hypothetical protein
MLPPGVTVNRSLVLTGALSLLAVLLCATPGVAQSPTIVRGTPVRVTSNTTPKRDHYRPYTFTTTGRIVPPVRYCAPNTNPTPGAGNCLPVVCPPGATDIRYCLLPGRAVICAGVVTVRYQKRGTTISSRNVGVRPDCTYRSRVSFRTRLRTRVGNLSVRSRFQGNAVLMPRNSSRKTVRAG